MPTIHLVSHTHWDREWYQPFQLFRLRLIHLIDHVLELLDTDPQFKYFMLDGQAIALEDYLQMRPDREAALACHVQSGRLLIGPWYVLPDEFLVSPEALIRNLLWGERVCRRLGPKLACGYLPDTFGHIGQMPQILRRYGFETAALWRGVGDQPCELWWEAPDGSRVFLAHLRRSYSNGANLPMAGFEGGNPATRELFPAELLAKAQRMAPYAPSGQILIMFGTDHMEPSDGTAAAVAFAQGKLGPYELVHSTLPAYLEAVTRARAGDHAEPLPLITGELRNSQLQHLLRGVLSTRMWIKQRNWDCETVLEKWAEPFSAWAGLLAPATGLGSGPAAAMEQRLSDTGPVLQQAWRLLLECHPHDSICGCGVDETHEEMRPRFAQVEQIAGEIIRQSLVALAGVVNTRIPRELRELRELGQLAGATGAVGDVLAAIVVFNAAGSERGGVVQVTMPARQPLPAIVDEYGVRVPYRLVALDNHEVAYQALDREGLAALLLEAGSGQVGGMGLVAATVRRNGSALLIQATLSAYAAPNPAELADAEAEIRAAIADPAITSFLVRGVSEDMTVELLAEDVPAFGFRTFWMRDVGKGAREHGGRGAREQGNGTAEEQGSKGARGQGSEGAGELGSRGAEERASGTRAGASGAGGVGRARIENEYLRVEVEANGRTLCITDRRTGQVYSGLNRFEDGGDCGDEYNYCPPAADLLVGGPGGAQPASEPPAISVTETPVASSLTVAQTLRTPAGLSADRSARSDETVGLAIYSTATLVHGVPRVDMVTEIDNTAKDHRLRAHFPVPAAAVAADYGGHFEVVRRSLGPPLAAPDWEEQPRPEAPQRGWTDVSDGEIGLMVAARGLPEVEVISQGDHCEIALTLLRCVGWLSRDDFPGRRGHAGPPLPTPGAQMPGRHSCAYALIPHMGGWQEACHEANAFAVPLRAVTAPLHAGRLAPAASLLRSSPPDFEISAIKLPDDGPGLIVRGYNRSDAPIEVSLAIRPRFGRAARAGLDEAMLAPLPIEPDGSLCFNAGPHEIVTVRFE